MRDRFWTSATDAVIAAYSRPLLEMPPDLRGREKPPDCDGIYAVREWDVTPATPEHLAGLRITTLIQFSHLAFLCLVNVFLDIFESPLHFPYLY